MPLERQFRRADDQHPSHEPAGLQLLEQQSGHDRLAGARVVRPVAMDAPITSADVEIKPSTVYSLRQLQDRWSQGAIAEPELLSAIDQLATD